MVAGLYKYIRILSLDVAAGACSMSFFLSIVLSTALPCFCYLILASSVWLIYTFDHLMDAQKICHAAHTSRHLFHQRNFKIIFSFFILILMFSAGMTLLNLSDKTIVVGCFLLIMSTCYLILIRFYGSENSILVQKELIVAMVYCLGISTGPVCYMKEGLGRQSGILILQIFFIALINLIFCAYLDLQTDMADGHASIVRYLGKRKLLFCILFIISLYMITAVVGCLLFSDILFLKAQAVLACMLIILSIEFCIKPRLSRIELLKGIADAVFFLPLLITIV